MRSLTQLAAATAVVATCAAWGADASAQEAATPVEGTGKGIAGFALIGGSAVMLTEAAFSVQPWWAYLAGGLGGAVAGGVGGYFFEDAVDPKLSMASLFIGTALIIPTTVIVLSTTTYSPPPPSADEEPQPQAEPARDASARLQRQRVASAASRRASASRTALAPRTASWAHRAAPARLQPPALLALSAQGLSLGVPAPEARSVFSLQQQAVFGAPATTELRFPVLRATF